MSFTDMDRKYTAVSYTGRQMTGCNTFLQFSKWCLQGSQPKVGECGQLNNKACSNRNDWQKQVTGTRLISLLLSSFLPVHDAGVGTSGGSNLVKKNADSNKPTTWLHKLGGNKSRI